jgi:hypothetical protein
MLIMLINVAVLGGPFVADEFCNLGEAACHFLPLEASGINISKITKFRWLLLIKWYGSSAL